jgi:Uma2 family endonuclease
MVVRVAEVEEPLQHMVLSHVSWETFEKLLDEIGEVHRRAAYHNGDLELMTVSFEHDHYSRWIGRLIFFVALEMQIPLCSGGSTTLKQALGEAGIEPDECFWTKHEKQMRGKKKWNALTDPPPDLAVEIDITSSWLDRLGIYAALGVPEVWRYDGEKLRVLILGAGGKYRERAKSVAFPSLPLDGLARFIARVDSTEETTLTHEFVAWLREEVAAKNNGGAARKNGKKGGG